LHTLDPLPDERFDRIIRTVKRLFSVPIAFITLVDANRQWLYANGNLSAEIQPDETISSAKAIIEDTILVIPDTKQDARFANNPMVTSAPHARFYAGRLLSSSAGGKLGTLCLLDSKPRRFDQADLTALHDLAFWAETELKSVVLNRTQEHQPTSTTMPAVMSEEAPLILLAEDNPANQKLTIMQLQKLGYKVQAVNSGVEVLEAVTHGTFCLILMDCQMPDVDGFEATRRIRQAELGSGQHLPIIAMTANDMSQDWQECLAAGMDDYLPKPVNLKMLQDKIAHWLALVKQSLPNAQHSTIESAPAELDAKAIKNLRRLAGSYEPGFLTSLIDDYLVNADSLLHAMRIAVSVHDVYTVNRTAHTLKSSSANYGATKLSVLCRELEIYARLGRLDGAEERLQRIEAEFARVKVALELLHAGKQMAHE
jgi:CheY-like chemotaxis protein/HPt (histidine-containing phosphotransfer) domain-containing protein